MNLEQLAENVSIADVIRIVNYIKTYFILPEGEDKIDYIIQGIKRLKAMFDLDDTNGLVTPQTLHILDYHRCGVPDALNFEEANRDYNRFLPGMTVKWYIDDYVDGLTKDDQIAIYTNVYNHLSNIINLKFQRVNSSNSANLVIHAANRGNGLGSQNGTLAYAYLAPKRDFTGQLDLVLDLAEIWIKDSSKRGILLYNVFYHETLHNMGLSHSNVRSALMAPYYSANIANPQQNDDISRLINLYGKAKEAAPVPQEPENPTIPQPPIDKGAKKIIIEVTDIHKIEIPGYRISKIQ